MKDIQQIFYEIAFNQDISNWCLSSLNEADDAFTRSVWQPKIDPLSYAHNLYPLIKYLLKRSR